MSRMTHTWSKRRVGYGIKDVDKVLDETGRTALHQLFDLVNG